MDFRSIFGDNAPTVNLPSARALGAGLALQPPFDDPVPQGPQGIKPEGGSAPVIGVNLPLRAFASTKRSSASSDRRQQNTHCLSRVPQR